MTAATAPPSSPPRSDRFRLDVLAPAAIRVGAMAVQLIVLAWLNGSGPSLSDRLLKWDGLYYRQIAGSGYSSRITIAGDGSLTAGNDLAFHPLFPLLAGLLHAVTRIPVDPCVLLVAALSGIAASVAVHLLAVDLLGSRRAGYIACALLGVLPVAVTLQMGYAEPLFLALAAFAVRAALRGQWWPAGGLVFAAGLTRPTGLVLIAVIPLAALWLVRRSARPVSWPRVLGASVVGAAGVPSYWVYLWIRTGRPAAWFLVEKHGWDSHFDFGAQTIRFVHDTLRTPDTFLGPIVCAIIAGYLLAVVLTLTGRWPYPLTATVTLSFLLALTSTNYWHSKPRLLLTAFLVVIPAAAALARFRTQTVVLVLLAGTLAEAWFGAYMLAVWPYAI